MTLNAASVPSSKAIIACHRAKSARLLAALSDDMMITLSPPLVHCFEWHRVKAMSTPTKREQISKRSQTCPTGLHRDVITVFYHWGPGTNRGHGLVAAAASAAITPTILCNRHPLSTHLSHRPIQSSRFLFFFCLSSRSHFLSRYSTMMSPNDNDGCSTGEWRERERVSAHIDSNEVNKKINRPNPT